jgi:hypothetical protein
MAKVIQVDGSIEVLKGAEGGKLTLKQMQEAVGGLIEYVAQDDPQVVVFANEEGLLIGQEINPAASLLLGRPLVGPVLVASSDEVD